MIHREAEGTVQLGIGGRAAVARRPLCAVAGNRGDNAVGKKIGSVQLPLVDQRAGVGGHDAERDIGPGNGGLIRRLAGDNRLRAAVKREKKHRSQTKKVNEHLFHECFHKWVCP
ncbi:MAG TPA: hypothetical protein VIK53_04900 [Verrucomicrobiae bacterium]